MIRATTDIRINRPLADVFRYVAEPRNFPAWNSAVETVRPVSGDALYVMERELPGGRATNELGVTVRDPEREFAFRTTSGPTPLAYRMRFTPADDATVMHVDVSASLGRAADLAAPIARSVVRRGVDANLATLKRLLERDPAPA
jgi:uncharacterized protein YndB with AHSA1/START domain